MEWQNIFFPVSLQFSPDSHTIGSKVLRNEGETIHLEGKRIAFLSVETEAPRVANALRESWYQMRNAEPIDGLVDLGDFIVPRDAGEKEVNELGYALSELMEREIIVFAFSSVPGLVPRAVEKAHEYLKQRYNAVEVNQRIADVSSFGAIDSKDWLTAALQKDKPYLAQYGLLGYQTFYVGEDQVDYLDKLGFESSRLGAIKRSLISAEPAIRSAHYLKYNAEAIQAQIVGNAHKYPNGLNGEEACALMRFGGASSSVAVAGFEHSGREIAPVAAELYAQMLWYFTEGALLRYEEKPLEDETNFTKYLTHLEDTEDVLVFFKSNRTDKWWMHLPVEEKKYPEEAYLIPCTYEEYQQAASGEVPNKWLHAVNRLSIKE